MPVFSKFSHCVCFKLSFLTFKVPKIFPWEIDEKHSSSSDTAHSAGLRGVDRRMGYILMCASAREEGSALKGSCATLEGHRRQVSTPRLSSVIGGLASGHYYLRKGNLEAQFFRRAVRGRPDTDGPKGNEKFCFIRVFSMS